MSFWHYFEIPVLSSSQHLSSLRCNQGLSMPKTTQLALVICQTLTLIYRRMAQECHEKLGVIPFRIDLFLDLTFYLLFIIHFPSNSCYLNFAAKSSSLQISASYLGHLFHPPRIRFGGTAHDSYCASLYSLKICHFICAALVSASTQRVFLPFCVLRFPYHSNGHHGGRQRVLYSVFSGSLAGR